MLEVDVDVNVDVNIDMVSRCRHSRRLIDTDVKHRQRHRCRS